MNPNKQLEAIGRLVMKLACENQELNDIINELQVKLNSLLDKQEKIDK